MERHWKIWLGVSAALTALYFVVINTGLGGDNPGLAKLLIYNGIGLISLTLLLHAVHVKKITPRVPWLWFASGLASFLTADVIFYIVELRTPEGEFAPFPNPADFFYLSMYPLMMVGLTKMVRAIAPGRDKASFIDAGVVAIAMFGVLWVLFVDTTVETAEAFDFGLIVQLAYPVMDVALLAVAARLVVTLHLKHKPFAFILVAIGSLAIADTAYNITINTFESGTYIDFFWLAFYVLFGAAALHPDAAVQPDAPGEEGKLTVRQLAIMFIATLAVPFVDLLWGTAEDRNVTIVASALLFLLILVRVYTLMQRLRHEAEHDALTGLSNRVLFAERTEAALAKSSPGNVAVLFIDLDDFKNVNDSLGHQAGDILLAEIASRLGRCIGPNDTVARFGGDEFAVLLEGAPDRRAAINVARQALDAFSDPIDLGARTFTISASIGIAMDLDSKKDVESLLRNADVAMYLSKSRGKGRYEFFEPIMHEEAVERLELMADLHRALEKNEFVLHYQPIFDFKTSKVALVEALIRWKHPTKGLIAPDRFISLAEESGLIVPIGDWVLTEACLQLSNWQKIDGYKDLSITVNLSMRQLQDLALLNSLTHSLKESGIKAESLVLEITESMLALDAERSAGILEQLRTIGVKIAIDDFGTGYSSLSYLRSFPVDSIKIDRSFINELHRSSTSTALVEAVVNLSRALGAYTVAEGIEHSDQAALLRQLGCDRGQGYYYCRPLAGPALTTLLKDQSIGDKEPLEAWRESSEKIQQRIFDVQTREGLKSIRTVTTDIDQLNADLGTPLMASWPWLNHWCESFENWTPIMIEVRAADSGQLMAFALLAKIGRGESTAVVAMGHGSSLLTHLQARNADAAQALATGIADMLNSIDGVWSLELEQIPELDPVLLFLADELEQSQLLPELRIPRVVFSTAHDVNEVLSKSMRKQIRRAQNKIHNDDLEMTIGFDRGRAVTMELIDEVEAVHISRDRHARRDSDLDRPAEREFWRRVCESPNGDWEVEIATLRLNGDLAAYVVALLDGDTYRVYDGRMATEFKHYSPGRLVEAAALSRAMADDRYSVLDWMNGIAAEKLLTANVSEGRSRLVATSGSSFLGETSKSERRRHRSKAAVTTA